MVILIFPDGLIIFIYVITYKKTVKEEVCLWPPQ